MTEGHAGIEIHGARGWLVGVVVNGELCGRWRHANFIQRPPAIAFFPATVARLELLDVKRYTIRNVDAGTVYTITRERFARFAYLQDGIAGKQWRAPLEYWDVLPMFGAQAVPAT